MIMAVVKGTKRTELGSRKARRMRKQGEIPAIVYGHGEEAEPITLYEHDVELAVLHGERLLELELDDRKENVLIKDIQYDTFGHEILHLDLTRVSLDERVEVTVPIVLRGTPAGAVEGGVLHQTAAEATVECLVTAIPEELRVSVAEMKIDDVLHMRDVPLPEGAKLLEDPETIVCSLSLVAEEVVAPVAVEAPAGEPEVIGEKAEEKEEEKEEEGRKRPEEEKK